MATLLRGGASTNTVSTALLEANSDTFGVDFNEYKVADTRFVRVCVELIGCVLAVFLGTHRICHNKKVLAYCLYFVSSACLLWATFYRQYYLHYTPVAHAIKSEGSLMKDYLFVSMASWILSLFLESTLSARFLNLLKRIFRGEYRVRWSCGMIVALVVTAVCTVNSLYLTLKLQEAVKLSLRNVSSNISVLGFLYVANRMRCFRQFMEGVTFITELATKWQNRTSKMLFGRIALMLFVLLFHHSILIYSFVTQKPHVWRVEHYFNSVSLSVDVLFRLCVCLWAIHNSCCFADPEHGDLEACVDHAQDEMVVSSISITTYFMHHNRLQDEMVVSSISITAYFMHHNQLYPHNQCIELANQHLNRTYVQQLFLIQPFPPPSHEINHPLTKSIVLVVAPFLLTNLETYPQSESGYLLTSSTITGRLEHLSSITILHTKAELVPPSNINIPSLHGSELAM